jgi:hypothetical protein
MKTRMLMISLASSLESGRIPVQFKAAPRVRS